ncbi:MAG: hypothetical protein JWP66_1542 [Naasia sp.]|nr:hypothetical protein [Naasia sp.]
MLYLLAPSGRMSWAATAAAATDVDPSTLDWTPAEDRADETMIRIALRRGAAVYGGIVVDGAVISDHHLSRRLVDTRDDARGARERMSVGYAERATAGAGESREAERELREHEAGAALGRSRSVVADSLSEIAADAALVAHWRRLGGHVPHPL